MATIREYSRQFGAQAGDFSGRRATPEDMGVAGGIADLAQGIGKASAIMKHHEENAELAYAQVQVAEAENVLDEKVREIQAKATPGVSTTDEIKSMTSDYYANMGGQYKTQKAQQYVKLHGVNQTGNRVKSSIAFDVDLAVKDRFVQIDKISEINERAVLADPNKYTAIKNNTMFEMENGVGLYNFPGDARHKLALQAQMKSKIENLAYMAAQGDLQNPAVRGMIVGSVKAPVNTEGVIQTLLKREGGYVVNDAGRGETNFGINKTAHPNEDIKGMTAEKAAQIYKRDYWDAYGVGNLDPSVQAVVFDGVVNHRSGFKEQLVSAAKNGASAQQLGEMRMAEYRRLAEADPSKAKYMTSWTKRVNDTIREVAETSSQVDTPPELKQKPAWWDDLSAERQIQVTRNAQTLEHQNRSIADKANAKLINDAGNYFSAYGKMPDTAPKLNSVTEPEQRQQLQTLYEASNKLAGIMDKPAAEQNAYLERNKPQDSGIPGDFTYQMGVYKDMVDFVNKNQKLRQEDQVTAAYKMGFGGKQAEIKPIAEYGDGEKLGVEIAQRVAHTDAIQKTWNMKENKILMSGEAENIRTTFRGMNVQEQSQYLAGLSQNITKEHFNALAQQVWKGDHEVRGAAILSTFGDTKSQNGDSAARTSELILMGRREINSVIANESGEKNPGGKGVIPSDTDIRMAVGEHLKGVVIGEEAMHTLTKVVKAHYIGYAKTNGTRKTFDIDDSENKGYLKQSLKTVLGEPSTVGTTRARRPWGMSDSQFQEEVKQQANELGYMGRNYGLIENGNPKQYQVVINGVAQKDVIDLNRPNYKQLQSGGDTIEPRDTGIYADAFKTESVKEALGLKNVKLPKGRADELGWWEQ